MNSQTTRLLACESFFKFISTERMEFVSNANFKGEFKKKIDLHHLHTRIPNSKLHTKPFQLVIRDLQGTLILFSNGKFRTMGCIDELEAAFLAYTYLEKLKPHNCFPSITLQSYTLKCELGFRINLEKMVLTVPSVYEPQLFPALRLKEYKPVSVNIFTTGKVVVCGLKDPDEMYGIISNLKKLCEPYKIRL